jgi:hypothetical protein
MLVEYVRGKRGGLVGCVVAVLDKNMIKLGWSKCMVKPPINSKLKADKFDKDYALDKAIGRALSTKDHVRVMLLGKGKSLSTQPMDVPSSVRPTLRKMEKRVVSYFKQFQDE